MSKRKAVCAYYEECSLAGDYSGGCNGRTIGSNGLFLAGEKDPITGESRCRYLANLIQHQNQAKVTKRYKNSK